MEEPVKRALTGAPLRWRLHAMFEPDFIPLGFYRELEGVVWDCPDCGTVGGLVLRFKRFDGYTFRCRSCRRKTEFNGISADQLAVALGVPLGRRRAPEIKVWIDDDLQPHKMVDGKEVVVSISPEAGGVDRAEATRAGIGASRGAVNNASSCRSRRVNRDRVFIPVLVP